MQNVPLVRPNIPSPAEWEPYLQATKAMGQYSNFGPAWDTVAEKLSEMSGRIALPCSNGTDALVIALEVVQPAYVYYEAFTFQATELAAKRYLSFAVPIRTGQPIEDDGGDAAQSAVIRTVPFGAHRDIKAEPRAQLIIDAAGAFGPSAFQFMPEDAVITCSFHATKNFPIGEGGCVFLPKTWTRQVRVAKAVMNFGLDSERQQLRHLRAAGNYKLDEAHCGLLLAQLQRKDVFVERSARIGHESELLARGIKDAWLGYKPGLWQSMTVIGHREPDVLVKRLASKGYTARRVYHPFIKPNLLTYDEARLVALPTDCDNPEFWAMMEAANP